MSLLKKEIPKLSSRGAQRRGDLKTYINAATSSVTEGNISSRRRGICADL